MGEDARRACTVFAREQMAGGDDRRDVVAGHSDCDALARREGSGELMNVFRPSSSRQRLLLAGVGGAVVLVVTLVVLGVISGAAPLPAGSSPAVTAVVQ